MSDEFRTCWKNIEGVEFSFVLRFSRLYRRRWCNSFIKVYEYVTIYTMAEFGARCFRVISFKWNVADAGYPVAML